MKNTGAAVRRYLLFGNLSYALPILRPLQNMIRQRGGEAAWFFHGDGAQHLRKDEVLLPDTPSVRRFNPDAVFVPGNWVPHFFPGVKVRVGHGFAVPGKENNFSIRGLFDMYCTLGQGDTPEFSRLSAAMGHFKVVETGWPKLDPLFDPGVRPLEVASDRPIVLYASTFTKRLTSAPYLIDTIRDLSRTGRWRWLITLHPKLDRELVREWRKLEGEHLRYVETADVIPFLKAGDAMVCDTSSILLEFITQVRPVVTFRHRGPAPAPHLINVTEENKLAAAIELALSHPPSLMTELGRFAQAIYPHQDSHSSERILDAIDEFITTKGYAALRPKPWNVGRKLQMRKRLGYWGKASIE
jgi:CDP-Glycerol:Poly(glycerophosphate) glycerophosphotransferase